MPKKFNAFDEKTPAPRLGSLHDVRRVVSLKENKTNHSHERVVIRPPMPKGKYEIQRKYVSICSFLNYRCPPFPSL
jgi:hypothetical protein